MKEDKNILLLGGGVDSLGIVVRAKEMGLTVMVADKDDDCPARDLADRYIKASAYDGYQVIDLLEGSDFVPSAVLCAGTDAPMVMATVAYCYGLVGPSQRTAKLSHDKHAQKKVLSQAGVNVPKFRATSIDELPAVHRNGQWMILKPKRSRGARGVLRTKMATKEHFQMAAEFDVEGHVIMEEWINGTQLSTESLVQDGRILWTAFSERNYGRLAEFAPHVIEDGGDTPPFSVLPVHENDYTAKAEEQLQKCVNAMGFQNGSLKGDLVWDGYNIWVIEVATRLSGGRFCSDIIPRVYGIDFVGIAIRIALGDYIWPGEIRPYVRCRATQRFKFPVKPTCHPERGESTIFFVPNHLVT